MNKAQIMKRAWEIKRENQDNIFGLCLKMAWKEAKEGAKEMTQREKDEKEDMEQAAQWNGTVRLVESRWQKYGKDRTYVEARTYTNGGMHKRTVKAGYLDNITGEWITDKDLW